MSLEEALSANTSAVLALLKELQSHKSVGQLCREVGDAAASAAIRLEDAKTSPKAAKPDADALSASGEQSQLTGELSSPALTYDDVAKSIVALSRVDLQKAKDVLSRFGVKNGKQLTPEQWPEVKALAESVLAGGDV